MDLRRNGQQKRQRSRDPLDRRVDQWLETGRQFVDGVAGTRPGKRRPVNTARLSSSSLETMGRWVGDKLDWFFEDEDGWLEPWEAEPSKGSSRSKRPLEAISRRGPKAIRSSDIEHQVENSDEEWPEDSSFRIDRWQRSSDREKDNRDNFSTLNSQSNRSDRRPIPRSSRRRTISSDSS